MTDGRAARGRERLARGVSLAAAALLALATCAGAAPPEGAPPPQPGSFVVGGDRDYPPYEFLDADGKPAGFNVELTRAIAEVMGLSVELRLGDWSEMRAALAAGRIDALEGMSYSEERSREVDFAPPHSVVSHAIFARRGAPRVGSLEELRGRAVALHRSGIMDDALSRLGMGGDLVRTSTPAEALRLVASGRLDYAVVAVVPGTYLVRELKLTNVVPVVLDVASVRYGHAVRKGNAELLGRLTEGLAILKKTGRYEEIHERWLGVLEPRGVSLRAALRWAALAGLPLLAVLGGTVLWSRSLKAQVAQRTESLAREVKERERAMEQLRLHQQQLVQADRMAALGVLVSGVAHEVNNPNGLILLNTPTLREAWLDAVEILDGHAAGDPGFTLAGVPYERMREEIPRLLDEMHEGGRRIKRIVEDLKDFARREDAPRLSPTELNPVVKAAVRLVEASIRKATWSFGATYGEELPRFLGNAQRIEQVVVNLVLNACQALPAPTRAIEVVTRRGDDGDTLVLEVKDEGVGIPEENLARLTDPFFTTKRESGGTGLGLSVSAGIVSEHRGRLAFRSAPGEGTTATLTLPALHEEGAR